MILNQDRAGSEAIIVLLGVNPVDQIVEQRTNAAVTIAMFVQKSKSS